MGRYLIKFLRRWWRSLWLYSLLYKRAKPPKPVHNVQIIKRFEGGRLLVLIDNAHTRSLTPAQFDNLKRRLQCQ